MNPNLKCDMKWFGSYLDSALLQAYTENKSWRLPEKEEEKVLYYIPSF